MRYTLVAAVAVAALTSAFPAFAQDRTPPAGSLRALQAPIDQQSNQFDRGVYGLRAPYEGRSVFRSDAPDLRDQGMTDGR